MDWKELDKQWLALGQRMKLHGERLYPEWQWELSSRGDSYHYWIRDTMALKARQVIFGEDEEGHKHIASKHGIIIDIDEAFLLKYLAVPDEEKLAVIEHVLHGAIEEAILIASGAVYPSYYPYYRLSDGRHEWKRGQFVIPE